MVATGRFQKLSGELAAKGAAEPDALAAWIGRKKYGEKGMDQLRSLKDDIKNAKTNDDRKGIYDRAKRLGRLGDIPSNWKSDGSLR